MSFVKEIRTPSSAALAVSETNRTESRASDVGEPNAAATPFIVTVSAVGAEWNQSRGFLS